MKITPEYLTDLERTAAYARDNTREKTVIMGSGELLMLAQELREARSALISIKAILPDIAI